MDGDDQFDDIQTALQGTTVLKTPRVSREVSSISLCTKVFHTP